MCCFSWSYVGKLSDVGEALPGFLHLLGVQRLPQSLLGQMSVQLQPHPGLAVLAQEVPFIRPEVNWWREKRQMTTLKRRGGGGKPPNSLAHFIAPSVREFSTRVNRRDGFKLQSKQNPDMWMKRRIKGLIRKENFFVSKFFPLVPLKMRHIYWS